VHRKISWAQAVALLQQRLLDHALAQPLALSSNLSPGIGCHEVSDRLPDGTMAEISGRTQQTAESILTFVTKACS